MRSLPARACPSRTSRRWAATSSGRSAISLSTSKPEAIASAEANLRGVGRIAVIASAAGLLRVDFLAAASPRVPKRGTGAAARMRDRALRELAAYSRGGSLSCPVVIDHLPPFARKVMTVLRRVPRGKTVGYGALAAQAGSPGAARAVGNAMARNPIPLWVPCHSVLSSNGLGGFSGGLDVKRKLLAMETGP